MTDDRPECFDWESDTAKTWAFEYELRVRIPYLENRAAELYQTNPTFSFAVQRWSDLADVPVDSILTGQHASELRLPGRLVLPASFDVEHFRKLHSDVPVALVKRDDPDDQRDADRRLNAGHHRSPKNDKGELMLVHRHLLHLTPTNFDAGEWSDIGEAYRLIRGVRERRGHDPFLMEDWDDRAPRAYTCDTCQTVVLARRPTNTRDDTIRYSYDKNPTGCPTCSFGQLNRTAGWPVGEDDDDD